MFSQKLLSLGLEAHGSCVEEEACIFELLLAAETGVHLWQARAGATAAPCSSWPGERDMRWEAALAGRR